MSKHQTVFYTIKGSTIKKFIILDCIMGSSIYYLIKIISSSVLIGFVASVAGTEGIKRAAGFYQKVKSSL